MKKTILLSFIFCVSCLLSAAAQEYLGDTISFLHITDTHISDLSGYHSEIVSRRKHYGQGEGPFADFITHAPGKSGASFIALTGDMIDFYEGQTPADDMRAGQIESFTKLLSSGSVPIYMTLGNHDIKSAYNSAAPDYHSKPYYAADEQARATWVQNVPCFRNGVYYSKIVKTGATVYRLIFLDNGYYKEKPKRDKGLPFVMDVRQLSWLKNQLDESDTDFEIIFMHMPLPWGNHDEKISPFPDLSAEDHGLYRLLNEYSSIRLILTGHEHDNALKDFQTKSGKITQLMTGAFGKDPGNWRLIHLTGDTIFVSKTGHRATQKAIKTHR